MIDNIYIYHQQTHTLNLGLLLADWASAFAFNVLCSTSLLPKFPKC